MISSAKDDGSWATIHSGDPASRCGTRELRHRSARSHPVERVDRVVELVKGGGVSMSKNEQQKGGGFVPIGDLAQRPAPHLTHRPGHASRPAPRRHRRVALAGAAFALLGLMALPSPAAAQTTITLVSNTGQTDGDTGNLGAFDQAQAFTTAGHAAGYTLTGVDIEFATLVPSNTASYAVSIRNANSSGLPGTSVGTLTSPASLAANAVNAYTTSGIDLAASTTYFVVVDSSDLVTNQLQNTDSDSEDSGGQSGFSIANDSRFSDRALGSPSWRSHSQSKKIAVKGYAKTATDTTAPAFASAAANGTSLVITFDEDLAAAASLANSAFTVKKTSGGTEATVTLSTTTAPVISGKTVTLTLATALVSTDTAVKVTYTQPTTGSNNKLVDAASNATATFTDQTVTNNTPASDTTAPTVTSIARQIPTSSPTNANSLTWRVTFSEVVSNVDAADFSVAGTTATLAVSAVTGVTGAYDVTASGGTLASLNATVTLSFAATQNIQDAASNALTTTTPTGTNNNTYVVDNAAPSLTSATATGRYVEFRFSENVDKSNLPPASAFTVTADGIAFTVTNVDRALHPDRIWIGTTSPTIRQGQSVVISYADPTTGNDTNAIQDTAGNDAASFTTGSNSVPAVTNSSDIAAVVPGAPTGLGATANGTTRIDLSWTAPADNGGRVISGYKIEWSAAGSAPWTVLIATTDSTATTYSHTGLAAGATRHYRVSAINAIGTGAASNVDSATTGNNAPTVANAIPDQAATAGTAFSYAFPANTFSDADSDTLSYTATKADGTALPTWLSFTASTRAFSGTPQAADTGTVSVKVTASDGNGGSVSDEFDITVSAVADTTAPVFESAAANGTSLVITFDEDLAAVASLATSAFTVKKTPSGRTEQTVTLSTTTPVISGRTVTLTLATALVSTDTAVKVSYTQPATGSNNKLADATGNQTATFTDQPVTNNTGASDTTAPTVTITGVPAVSSAPFTAIFTFSEAVTGFVVGDITLGNATASNFTDTSTSVYTALITPTAEGTVTVDVEAGVAQDAARNGNTAASRASSSYTASPSPVISIVAGTSPVTEGTAATFTLTRTGNATAMAAAVTVDVSVFESEAMISGTAPTSVMLAANARTATLRVPTERDDVDEADSEVTVRLNNADANADVFYLVDYASQASVTVRDDDLPTIKIEAGGSPVTKGYQARFLLYREGYVQEPEPLTVQVRITETGAVLATPLVTEVEFTTGLHLAYLDQDTVSNDTDDAYSVVTATVVASPATYTVGMPKSATVTVSDDTSGGRDDTQPPVFTGATVNGSTLTLTYNEPLDGASVPAAGDFAVTAAGSSTTVTGVSVAGSTVTLTLATAVEANQAVTLAYTPGANPIQDAAGNDAALLSRQTVTNNARAQGTVAADRAALVALYNATGGANWKNKTNWLSNEALSEWHGVATDATGRVTDLYLPQNGLSGEIPVELGALTNLRELYLHDNELTGPIPAALGNLANLQILYLHENKLSGAIPAELGALTKLLQLYLDGNELSGEIPAALGNLGSLQHLISQPEYVERGDPGGAGGSDQSPDPVSLEQ